MTKLLRVGFWALFLFSIFYLQSAFNHHPEKNSPVSESQAGNLQIPFIANQGQIHESVKFYAQTFGGTVFVTEDGEIVYHLPQAPEHENHDMGLVIQESLVGGKKANIKGEGRSRTKVNFFKGRNWQAEVPAYQVVSLGQVYDGIELKLRASGNNVEKLFYIKPGGKTDDIKIKLTGTDRMKINEAGELHVESAIGSVAFTKPIAFQREGDEKRFVEVAYALSEGKNEYGFWVGSYDPDRELVIDPLLASTFLGGSSEDGFNYTDVNIVQDVDGSIIVAGKTQSLDFPSSVGIIQTNHAGGGDGFVARLDQDLTTLISATFIGGGKLEEIRALALDGSGNIFIAGITESSDYPTITNSYDRSYNGGAYGPYGSGDIFVSKLSSDLTMLLASTYLGGTSHECCEAMALDGQGNVYVTGGTASTNFPVTAGGYDNSLNPGGTLGYDICVSKFDNNLSMLLASTFLGGSNDDFSEAIALDKNGNVYLSGWIISSNFPTTEGAYKRTFAGGSYDAFVSRFDPNLATLSASTFLGGSQWDFAYGMTLDAAGNVYVTGHTASTNFPVSQNAFDKNYSGSGGQGVGDDVFVSKFDGLLTTLVASTYLGGSAWENGFAMTNDAQGNVYVTGTTSSTNFPTSPNAYDKTYDGGTTYTGDIFISRLNNDLSTLSASTYLGKKQKESTGALYIDSNQNILIAGSTASSDFPTTYGAYNEIYNGGAGDIFIVRLDSLLSLDPVQAKFHATPLTGHAPLIVQFTDSSTALQPITLWKWDFNHDRIYDSQEQHPSWTFNDPGTYSVLLEVGNGSASQKKLYQDLIHIFNGESALQFDGDKSKVTCPASASLNLQSQLTIEAKINPAGWGKAPNIGFGRIVDKKNFVLYLIGANPAFNDQSLALQLTHADGTVSISTSPENAISLAAWQHVAVTYDASANEVKMFINGKEQLLTQTKAPSGMIADHVASDLVIGSNASLSFTFAGAIDEARLWNTIRSKPEIQQSINHYLMGDEAGLVGYWKMNEGNGGVIKDVSNHQSDAAISGANWIQGAPLNLPTAVGMNLPQEKILDGFQLYPNYPNPFNSATAIRFRLPSNADVSIQIFNINGGLVRTLFRGDQAAGFHSIAWDGMDDSGSRTASGVYCYKMKTDSFSEAKKLILVK